MRLDSRTINFTQVPGVAGTALTAYARPDADKTGWMQPDDIAGVALFLAIEAASAITGTTIEVAGWAG